MTIQIVKTILNRLLHVDSNNIDIKTIWLLLFKISKSLKTKHQTGVEPNVDLLPDLRNEIDHIDNKLIHLFCEMKTNPCNSNICLNRIMHQHVHYRFRLTDECVKLLQQLFEKLCNQATIKS